MLLGFSFPLRLPKWPSTITDEEIDICSHIVHILSKNAEKTTLRNCLPFCCLISKILKLKGVHPLENEYSYPKQSLINIHTLNAIIGHGRKGVNQESHAPHGTSSSSSHPCDEKLNNIMASVQDISTKLFDLQLSCTHNILVLTQSLHLSKLNWTKSKGGYRKMRASYSMTKRGRWFVIGGGRAHYRSTRE